MYGLRCVLCSVCVHWGRGQYLECREYCCLPVCVCMDWCVCCVSVLGELMCMD